MLSKWWTLWLEAVVVVRIEHSQSDTMDNDVSGPPAMPTKTHKSLHIIFLYSKTGTIRAEFFNILIL